jgi:ADP-heptose:LPS heptosyltransferase
VLSRTDSIGDVVLTLPMAGVIKKLHPTARVIFMGRSYTKPVIDLCVHVDMFLNYDDIQQLSLEDQKTFFKPLHIDFFVHVFPVKAIAAMAKAIGIKNRIGTTNRLFHWFSCNKLVRLSRKKSPLHEAQLNLKLLSFLHADTAFGLHEIPKFYGFERVPKTNSPVMQLLDQSKIKVVLHPKSKGSAKEWGLDNFAKLIAALDASKFQVFIGGTKEDGELMAEFLKVNTAAVNVCGQLNLTEYIDFISRCDALVAASTGPLHIAAALNKKSIGLFTSKRPMHPGRWGPVGDKAKYLVYDPACPLCLSGRDCDCIQKIHPQHVIDLLA